MADAEAYMRLLLVEDDHMLAAAVQDLLRRAGYTVDRVACGLDALQSLEREHFSLVILDLGLPDMDGLELLSRLRQHSNPVQVLILSARNESTDRVLGLDTGADDYLSKPFDVEELLARIRVLLRRQPQGSGSNRQVFGDLAIDREAYQVFWQDRRVELTPGEFKLLLELVDHRGKVMTRDRLQEVVYGWDECAESNVLEVYVHHLRKKLDKKLIKTVRGVGYLVEELPAAAQV
ncbi:response regulator transcription factor [Spongorhabdus nitratireducens]